MVGGVNCALNGVALCCWDLESMCSRLLSYVVGGQGVVPWGERVV